MNHQEKPATPRQPDAIPAPDDRDKAAKPKEKGMRALLTLYRTTSRNHVALSAIADRKANFLLTLNTIIISVTFTLLVAKSEDQPIYTIPGLFLMLVCTVTMVFAVLSTRPTIGHGVFTRDQVTDKKANILFCGNFYRVPSDDYEWAMKELLNDRKFMRIAISNDIYQLGVVVARKFRFLRIGYTIFMVGAVLSILLGYLAIQYHLTWYTEFFKE